MQEMPVSAIVKPGMLPNRQEGLPMTLNKVAGEKLDTVLTHYRLDIPTCLRLASQLAQTLADLHVARLVHHDLHPANVMVSIDHGQWGLLDLRTSADARQTTPPDNPAAEDWAYFSPEQTGRMNHPVDYRADFYSLGMLFYRMFTGQLPFQGKDPLEWAHCHIARLPPPLRDIDPAVPQPVSDIVLKLLAKLPEERYQSAHGLQADLERCLAQWQACARIKPFPLGAEDDSGRFHIPHKLYGREQETATLLAAFDHMAATGDAALVTVSGYSGIGKSSLVHELHQPIVRERGYFIAGKFDQLMRDIPYATLTQAFRDLVQQLLAESEARIADWRQRIQAAVGANGQLIVDVLPQVELIIGKQAPVPALPPTEAQNRFRLMFQRFIAVFTHQEHPLALFLDDVQWADAASLQFIEHLLTQPDTRYLLLIAAYRDNEVSAAHPLSATLEAIRHHGAAVIDIRLAPLSVMPLNRLVADTLHAKAAMCEPLTHLIFERTEGNPFFFTQFLDALHKEGVLRHDRQERVWQWDLAHIKARDFADNVADLMAGKLRRLPTPTQEALQLAACLGNKFNLRALALVSQLAEDEITQRLSAAVREDLIVLASDHGKFLHDRIQQAAYALIPAARRAEVHLHIGRTLVAHMTADEMAGSLFDVANQFNRGAALLADADEKAQVAELNLRAGRKAKASAAYASACVYLAAGMALLDETDWGRRHALQFKLWLERAECEFLNGHLDEVQAFIAELLQRCTSKTDTSAVYYLKVLVHTVKSENPQAVDSALECLRLFGIDLPAHPIAEQVQAEYETVWRTLGGRPIESLIDLPPMSDPEKQAAMDVLMVLDTPAYFTDANLGSLLLCRMVNLSLQHGMSGAAAYGYASFGRILGPVFYRYRDGYRFGKLGCDLVEKHGFVAYKAKVYLVMGLGVVCWAQPITTTIDFLREALRTAIGTGDISMACISWGPILADLLLRSDPLDAVWRESEQGLDFVRRAGFRDMKDAVISQQRFIATMQGRTAHFSTFSDALFDEAAFEAQLTGDRSLLVVCHYWLLKMQVQFLSGDHTAVFATAQKAKALLWALTGQIQTLDYFYYGALTVAALYDKAPLDQQRAWRDLLTAHQEQLREWAENYPPTFRDKHALVSAEIARLDGRDADAMRLYEQAIQSARENGFVRHAGIAHELAAEFYLARGSATAARAHLEEARSCFARWGANGKVRQLEERYPSLLMQAASPSAVASGAGVAQLDALSVAKASQAISGRIVLDELVDTLMRILLENAGAQSGALLLIHGDDLVLAAEASVAQQTVQVQLPRGQPRLETILPAALLNYVRRSREPVLLADATEPHPFTSDPYFAGHQPKSVLCLPIVRQTTLMGVLYLENTLVTHAFTPHRMTILELLASQAAISLENSLLYTDLQQENSERKRAEATVIEREARIRRLVESNIIGVFFWDLSGAITDANDAFLQMVGYSRQELLSEKIQWTSLTPPEYHAADAQRIKEFKQTGSLPLFEKEFLRKDGSRIPILMGAAFFEESQETGVSFVLDLSERKQAEAEREARQAADAANRAKSAFLANMSHELRTPLNGILGYAQILQRNKTLDERQIAGLNVIRQSGEHLLTMINDILDFAKIEAGKLELSPGAISLAAFLRVIAEMVGVRAAQKGLDFILDMAPDLPAMIQADEKRLRQVLLNLLANAVKFTDRGQVMLQVRFTPPTRLRFAVRDTGVGIGEDQLDTIFQPFEQAGEMQRRLGGTGLGLAISRQFVHLMNSEIRVESRIGQGSTFWFELEAPVVKAEATSLPATSIVIGYAGPRKTVLVVDDVAENRAVTADMLRPLGFTIVEAVNGYEGLEKARVLQPDLILMDIVMPEMGGLEAMRRLRQWPARKEVPVIAVSASASGDNEASSLAAGANAFLPKPVDLERLLTQIGALLKLTWTYELPLGGAPQQEASGSLLMPPAQEMTALHRLARLGNMHDIAQWASELAGRDERYGPFANQLCQLAKGYQSKAILNLVKQYLEKSV